MCLFDTPSAGVKQALVPDSKTKNHQRTAFFGLPTSVAQGLLSAGHGHRATNTRGRILNMNFRSHRGASAAHSDAMQHFFSEGRTTGATAEGPSLHTRGKVPTKQNKIHSLSETHEDTCRQGI